MIEHHKCSPVIAVLQRKSWLEIEMLKPNKNISATVQQQMLNDRKNDYGVVALLDKQSSLARAEAELVETDAFITAIQTHRASLVA
jgi:hypothetical protein